MLQVRDGFLWPAFRNVASRDAFQCMRFLEQGGNCTRYDQCLLVIAAALSNVRTGYQISEMLEDSSLTWPVAEAFVQCERLGQCRGSCGIISHQALDIAEVAEGMGFAKPVTDFLIKF